MWQLYSFSIKSYGSSISSSIYSSSIRLPSSSTGSSFTFKKPMCPSESNKATFWSIENLYMLFLTKQIPLAANINSFGSQNGSEFPY